MKIRKVKWKDHPILGNLSLDFTNDSDQAYNTVVFAGENGTGKSTVLAHLSSFLSRGPFEFFEFIEYEVDELRYTARPPTYNHHPFFFSVTAPDYNVIDINWDRHNSPHKIDESDYDPRRYGCVYSKARADYKTGGITNISTSSIDSEKYDIDENDDFTSLKQLLVDVTNSDQTSYAIINQDRGPNPLSWDEFYTKSKLYRFKESFNNFFDNIKFYNIVDENGQKQIIFEKSSKYISIDKLSTGEKQIVFRGAHLLRNSRILLDGVIFIDEPELSMHPKLQAKILSYYRGLFTGNDSSQAQMFFATHSDHVVKAAMSDSSTAVVITLFRDGDEVAYEKHNSSTILPSITSGEANYKAFDLLTTDFHIELYGHLQEKYSKISVKSCDELIAQSTHYDVLLHRKPSSFGSTSYETLPTYIRNAIHHPDNGNDYTDVEFRRSIELLCKLCSQ